MLQINIVTINAKINELRQLLSVCKNPAYRTCLETDLKSYLAIKHILESAETKKRT